MHNLTELKRLVDNCKPYSEISSYLASLMKEILERGGF